MAVHGLDLQYTQHVEDRRYRQLHSQVEEQREFEGVEIKPSIRNNKWKLFFNGESWISNNIVEVRRTHNAVVQTNCAAHHVKPSIHPL